MIRIRMRRNAEQEPCFGCGFPARHGHEISAGVGAAVRRVFVCRVCMRQLMITAAAAVADSARPPRPITGNGRG